MNIKKLPKPDPVSGWKTDLLISFLTTDAALQIKEPSFFTINAKLRKKVKAELLLRAGPNARK